MCGVAGYLAIGDALANASVVEAMGVAISHRGPNGRGVFDDGPCGLAHRRLAIIDLSEAASQPMSTPDGRYTLSYNGEVYNFRELRSNLEERGCRFQSASDTEVVLHALATWGRDAIGQFNGMFAGALWDS